MPGFGTDVHDLLGQPRWQRLAEMLQNFMLAEQHDPGVCPLSPFVFDPPEKFLLVVQDLIVAVVHDRRLHAPAFAGRVLLLRHLLVDLAKELRFRLRGSVEPATVRVTVDRQIFAPAIDRLQQRDQVRRAGKHEAGGDGPIESECLEEIAASGAVHGQPTRPLRLLHRTSEDGQVLLEFLASAAVLTDSPFQSTCTSFWKGPSQLCRNPSVTPRSA